MFKVAEIWCHDSFGGRVVSSLLFTVLSALSAAHTADGPAEQTVVWSHLVCLH